MSLIESSQPVQSLVRIFVALERFVHLLVVLFGVHPAMVSLGQSDSVRLVVQRDAKAIHFTACLFRPRRPERNGVVGHFAVRELPRLRHLPPRLGAHRLRFRG